MNHVPGGWYEEVEYAHLWLTVDGELRTITALETRSLGRLEPTEKIIGNGPATTSDVSALDWTHVVSTWKGTTGNREPGTGRGDGVLGHPRARYHPRAAQQTHLARRWRRCPAST
jgi:hypothetical protein